MGLDLRMAMFDPLDRTVAVDRQCALLSISRSVHYYFPVPETAENLAMMGFMDRQYFLTPFYGARKLVVALKKEGYVVNVKKVRRLMGIIGWKTLYRMPRTTVIDPISYKYPYLLKGLDINHSNHVWEVDITYIPMARGFMYLFSVIDVYSRYIVGWDISNSMDAEWCAAVTKGAIEAHGAPRIVNSDQGSQFTADAHTKLLERNGIAVSMDGKGRAIDNIYIERFWRSIKYEDIYLKCYGDGLMLHRGILDYMTFYNTKRPHQSLQNQTPEEVYRMKIA